MFPIQITNVSVSGRVIELRIEVDPSQLPVVAVWVRAVRVAGGSIQRFANDDGLIRVHTPQPHGLQGTRRIIIENAQAAEANGLWTTMHVTSQEFSLKGSKFKGNVSAGNGAWRLSTNEEIKRRAEPTAPTTYAASLIINHPGTFSLVAWLTPEVGPPAQSDPQVAVVS